MTASAFAPRRPAATSTWLARAHVALLAGFLFYTFIGTHPFEETSVGNRVDGNILDRIVVLALFALALVMLAAQWRAALACLRNNLGLLSIVGFCFLSIVWSDYPALTLRRGLLFIFLTTIAMAIAVSLTDLRRFHTFLFVFLTGVVLLNLVGVVVAPSLTVTEIGVKGIYTQKNVAGIVAMITIILGVTWMLGVHRKRSTLIGLAALVPALIFLVITRSKTSINITALGVAMVVFFAMAERFGARFILFAGFVGLLLLVGLIGLLAAVDFDVNVLVSAVVGDTTFTGRDELWAFARREAQKRSWLGHGYGAYWDVGAVNDPLAKLEPGTWLASVAVGTINQAHHGYLELWLHVGLPATVFATLVVLKSAGVGALRAVIGAGSDQRRALIGGLAALLILYLLHNFTEATLFMRGAAFCNMATLAMFVLSRDRDFAAPPPGAGSR